MILHSKTALIDGVLATVGLDPDASDPITLEQWQRRPPDVRIKELFARLPE